jgi:uncharacterized Fe-S radical SAM superfamily protein PflX
MRRASLLTWTIAYTPKGTAPSQVSDCDQLARWEGSRVQDAHNINIVGGSPSVLFLFQLYHILRLISTEASTTPVRLTVELSGQQVSMKRY